MHKLEQRFDVFLSYFLKISREQSNKLIKSKEFYINSKKAKSSTIIKYLDEIKVDDVCIKVDDDIESNVSSFNSVLQGLKKPDEIKFYDVDNENLVDVLYEDEKFMVINKPTNLSTHGASSLDEPSLVDWLLKYKPRLSDILGKERSGIVHRLDKCTSGALIVAKDNDTHLYLSNKFANQDVLRVYLALINLPLKEDKVRLQRYIDRNEKNRLKKIALSSPSKNAKFSETLFANLYTFKDSALVCAKLYTGKTHQIRAHLESLSRHILGDELYGYKGKMERVMLHAFIIGINHPVTGEFLQFVSPFDDNFRKILNKHYEGAINEKDIFDRVKSVLGDDF